ncbi:MAG: acylneuraminate cytidylyltransferase [Chloroflexi bacterium]|nr:MAG: acylneuraminate cytidylyltransferase [Chloroflexota bacterium]
MNTVAIIQARIGSTRLPGKVLENIGGETMLSRVIKRTQRATRLDKIVIATTIRPDDDVIVTECVHLNTPVFRGDEQDVLDRYYKAAMQHQADVVVRITSDCPLIEPEVIDKAVKVFESQHPTVDYVANTLPPRTFPRGLDVEVMSCEALARAWNEDKNPAWREHVTPYIYRNPKQFNLYALTNNVDYSALRWTVDTPEDLELIRRIYNHFKQDNFNWRDVLNLLEQHPDWLEINSAIKQKQVD